ncbi:MAG: serine hydrolase domain-containing protein [Saprospiraceae bacterium]|nr:serine hydrolase domain-containing protein [Saprospiraceae bacterium]
MLFYLLVLIPGCLSFWPSDTVHDTLTQQLDSLVTSFHHEHDFSGAVLIARNGNILYSDAFGYANAERDILNTTDTKFLIGSTTKSFTALTCLQFVEAGLVSLDAPLSRYLPQLTPDIGKITIHHLLKMQAGLPNHLARLTEIEPRDIPVDEIIEIINTATVQYPAGTAYNYSNLNYHLIAAVLMRVSGLTFGEILERHCFAPLEMHHSGVERLSHIPPNRALGYDARSKGRLVQSYPNYTAWALGSGDIYSTVGDLLKWDQALYGDEYVSAAHKALAFNSGGEDFGHYGYGFRIMDYLRPDGSSGTLVRHGGSMYGYLANIHRYLDDRITVIILANVRPFPIRDLTFQLKEIVCGRQPGPRDHE